MSDSTTGDIKTSFQNSACSAFALRVLTLMLLLVLSLASAHASNNGKITFKGVRTQFIAALGDPQASSGYGAQTWGLWVDDPGPRGVWLRNFEPHLVERGGIAPANWTFDTNDWWLDENGIIMEKPVFSLPPGRYMVTGDREVVALLTIHEMDDKGQHRWELDSGATLYDVTHLPCRSARYTPGSGGACTPASVKRGEFPVTPGGPMPAVVGCQKQDYAVLFIVAVEVTD